MPLDTALARIARAGMDGVELLGEPQRYDQRELLPLLSRHGLRVTALTAAARLETGRDLSHPDAAVRERSIAHLEHCVRFAAGIGAPVVAVAPSAIGRHRSLPHRTRNGTGRSKGSGDSRASRTRTACCSASRSSTAM